MPPRAPKFWQNPPSTPGWQAHLLAPMGKLYALLTARRQKTQKATQLPVPVFCVGNLTAGGAGKTPSVIALIALFQKCGLKVHVVSRGYGGTAEAPIRVDPKKHRAELVGDESLLIANFAPCWVGKSRLETAQEAVKAGAEAILLDDGFQDPSLAKAFSFVVVNAERGFGNGKCIPAGPLREPVAEGLKRADAIILIGKDAERQRFLRTWRADLNNIQLFEAEMRPLPTGHDWQDTRVLAFAGIAYPEKFFAALREMGAHVVRGEALGDHGFISEIFIERLLSDGILSGCVCVTTEKDIVRVPSAYVGRILTFPVRVVFETPDGVFGSICGVMGCDDF